MTDQLSTLYPDDAPEPPRKPGDGLPRQFGAMLQPKPQRGGDDLAARLYPGDRPAGGEAGNGADGTTASLGDAKLTYADDAPPFDDTVARGLFNQFSQQAMQDGDADRAAQWTEVGDGLIHDLANSGASSEDLNAALMGFQEALSDGPQVRAENQARTMQALRDQYGDRVDRELASARRLIQHLDATVAPGLVDTLERTGAGSNLRVIKAAIKEARRRGM